MPDYIIYVFNWLKIVKYGIALMIFAIFLLMRPTAHAVWYNTWTGGGTDETCGGSAGDGNKWSCAANWDLGHAPAITEVALFNGTSNKAANIDSDAVVAGGIEINGYTNTITVTKTDFSFGSHSTVIVTSFYQSSGTFIAPTGTLNIIDAGFTRTGGTFTANGGTVNFEQYNNNFDITAGGTTFNNLTFDNTLTYVAVQTIVLHDSFTVDGDWTVKNSNAEYYGVEAAEGAGAGIDIRVNGDLIFPLTPLEVDGFWAMSFGTGSGSYEPFTVSLYGDLTIHNYKQFGATINFENQTADQTVIDDSPRFYLSSYGTWNIDKASYSLLLGHNLASDTAGDGQIYDLNLISGTFDTQNYDMPRYIPGESGHLNNFSQSGGTFTGGTSHVGIRTFTQSNGTFNAPSGSLAINNFNQSGGTFNGNLVSAISVSQYNVNIQDDEGNFVQSGGIFNAPATLTVSNDFDRAGTGTFNNNGGTVQLISVSTPVAVTGSTTFYDFTASDLNKTINFTAGTRQTITHAATIRGQSASNRLTLRSSSSPTEWEIDPQGTIDCAYVDVKDSDNIDATYIDPTGSKDSGNTTFWFTPKTITASAGANGIIDPSGDVTVLTGANQSFRVEATAPNVILTLTVDGTPITGYKASPYTYTFTNVIANHTIAATFGSVPSYTITPTVGANGIMNPNTPQTVTYGDSKSFVVTANSNYYIRYIKVDGVPIAGSLTSPKTYTFTEVAADHTIEAAFLANNTCVWTGLGSTNNWSEGDNWTGNVVPSSTCNVLFDSTSTKNATIDGSFAGTIANFTISAGYTDTGDHSAGTITFARSLTSNGIYVQADGTVYLSSQTYTTTKQGDTFKRTGGTFDGGTGTVILGANDGTSGNYNITTLGATFYDLQVFKNDSNNTTPIVQFYDTVTVNHNMTVWNDDTGYNLTLRGPTGVAPTINITGNLSFTSTAGTGLVTFGSITATVNPTVNLKGNLDIADAGVTSEANINFIDTNAQTINQVAGSTLDFGDWIVNKTSGTVTALSDITKLPYGAGYTDKLKVTSGTFDSGNHIITTHYFEQDGGTFIASSDRMDIKATFYGTVFNRTGGNFDANGGTVRFWGRSNNSGNDNITTGGAVFNNLIFYKDGSGVPTTFSLFDGFTVNGDLTLSNGQNGNDMGVQRDSSIGSPMTITVNGNVSMPNTSSYTGKTYLGGGNSSTSVNLSLYGNFEMADANAYMRANTTFKGTAAQTLTMSAGTNDYGSWTVDKSSNQVSTIGDVTFNVPVTITLGTLNLGSSVTIFNSTFTQNDGAMTASSTTTTFMNTINRVGGSFSHNGGTAIINATTNTFSVTAGSANFNTLQFLKSSGTAKIITLNDSFSTAGNLTVQNDSTTGTLSIKSVNTTPIVTIAGDLLFPATSGQAASFGDIGSNFANNFTTNVSGNITISEDLANLYANVTLEGGNSQAINQAFGTIGYVGNTAPTWTINKSGGVASLLNNLNLSDSLTITQGTFTAGNFNLTTWGFTQTNGVFNAPASGYTFTVGSGFTRVTGNGTFNHQNGTVSPLAPRLQGTAYAFQPGDDIHFYNLTTNRNSCLENSSITLYNNFTVDNDFVLTSGCATAYNVIGSGTPSITVSGSLSFPASSSATVNLGSVNDAPKQLTINLGGNFLIEHDGSSSMKAHLIFNGVGAQTITQTAGVIYNGNWTINKPSGVVSLLTNLTLPSTYPFYDHTFTMQSGTFTAGSHNLTVGIFIQTGGTFNAPETGYTLSVIDGFDRTGGTVAGFNHSSGTVSFVVPENANYNIKPNGTTFYDVNFTRTISPLGGGTLTLYGDFTIDHNLVFNGTRSYTVQASGTPTVTVNGNITFSSSANTPTVGSSSSPSNFTFSLAGNLAFDQANNFYANVIFTGENDQTISYTTGTIYSNSTWTVNKASHKVSLITDVSGSANLTLTAGEFDASGYNLAITDFSQGNGTFKAPSTAKTLTVKNNFSRTAGTFTQGAGTVAFTATASSKTITSTGMTFNNLTFNGASGGWTPQDALNIAGNLTLSNGTLSGSDKVITIGGDVTKGSGSFTVNTSEVVFNDNSKISNISGSPSFYKFTCTTPGKTIKFAAGSTTAISNAFTLTGSTSSKITLRSSSDTSIWTINPSGTRSVSYVDVMDSTNSNVTNITANYSKDSGNNIKWDFPGYIPVLTTEAASSITENSATANGTLVEGGNQTVTRRGFEYGLSETPTWSVYTDGTYTPEAFTGALGSLSLGTTYNVRSFAVNAAGTGYGSWVAFTTTGPTVTLSRNNASINENGGTSTLTATLSGVAGDNVVVSLGLSGTATNPDDYTVIPSTITVTSGNLTGTTTITGVNDSNYESTESIVVDISSVTVGTESGVQQVSIDITDDDPIPTIAFAEATSNGVESATPSVTVSLTGTSYQDITIDYVASGGTATGGGTDYTLAPDTATITAGNLSTDLPLSITDDLLYENNETVIMTISNAGNATLGAQTTHTYTINDNDEALHKPTIGFASSADAQLESVISRNIVVSLSEVSGRPTSVNYAVTGGSATGGGTDYTLASGTATVATGDSNVNIVLSVINETKYEANETIEITLSGADGGNLGTSAFTYTINNDDSAPTVTLTALGSPVAEDGGTANFRATLSNYSSFATTVNLAFSGTAELDYDYTKTGSSIIIPADNLIGNFAITGKYEDDYDPDETVIADIDSVTNGTEDGTQQATITITNDDTRPTIGFSSDNSSGLESVMPQTITVTLNHLSNESVTVDYAVNGSSTATGGGVDYTLANGTATVSAGSLTTNISFTVNDDLLYENNETIIVDLSNPVRASGLGTNTTHTYTITDNDELLHKPTIGFTDATGFGAESVTSKSIQIRLNEISGRDSSVNYAVTGGTATAPDYTLAAGTATIGASFSTTNINLGITNDSIDELNQTVIITLSSEDGAALGSSSYTYTINDDDDPPTVQFHSVTQSGNENTTADIAVELTSASEKTITVDYITVDDTALDGIDYTAATGTLTFNATETSKNISVPLLSDSLDEVDETFATTISNPANATLTASPTQTFTITDIDAPPTVSLSTSATTMAENAGTVTITAALSAVSAKNITVTLAYGGTAVKNTDFTAGAVSISIPAGSASGTLTLTSIDNNTDDTDRVIGIGIDSITNATENGTQLKVVTIVDDEVLLTVTAGTHGTASPSGTLTLASGSSQTITFMPDDGYKVELVKVDYISVGAVSSYTLSNITTNHTVEASFIATDDSGETTPILPPRIINPPRADGILVTEPAEGFSEPTYKPLRISWILLPDANIASTDRIRLVKRVDGGENQTIAEGLLLRDESYSYTSDDICSDGSCTVRFYAQIISQNGAVKFSDYNAGEIYLPELKLVVKQGETDLSGQNASITIGKNRKMQFSAFLKSADGETDFTNQGSFTWSANEAAGKIKEDGEFKAGNAAGTFEKSLSVEAKLANQTLNQSINVIVDGSKKGDEDGDGGEEETEETKGKIEEVVTEIEEVIGNPIIAIDSVSKTVTTIAEKVGIPKEEAPIAMATVVSIVSVAAMAAAPIGNAATTFSSLEYLRSLFKTILPIGVYRRRKDKFGRIIEEGTEMPIPYALVTLVKLIENPGGAVATKRVSMISTNQEGQFGFIAEPGRYKLEVKKAKYFPICFSSGAPFNGHEFVVKSADQGLIVPTIVMSRNNVDIVRHMSLLRRLEKLERITPYVSLFFLLFGSFVVMSQMIHSYEASLLPIAFSYLVLLLVSIISLRKASPFGDVIDQSDSKPLPLSVIRILDKKSKRLIRTAVTNEKGEFSALVSKGEYQIVASKSGYQSKKPTYIKTTGKMNAVNQRIALAKEENRGW